jgi:branched-subunit amino acid aminotransferase/4-amino-4-deoxychorismate lyase
MNEPLAFLNGDFLSASQLAIPVHDAGFVLGATVAEQLRTFGGKLFRLQEHLQRLRRSLEIVGVEPDPPLDDLAEIALRLAAHNHALLSRGDDLGLSIFVTPGPYAAFAPPGAARPTVALHTYPLPFRILAHKYHRGDALATTSIRQVPPDCWPPELKCRSRMHYYLADQEAARNYPPARALMCDHDGRITEATTANVVLYDAKRGLLSPRTEHILPGISLMVLRQFADELGMPLAHADLYEQDVAEADEVFLTATSSCILPVVLFNGRPIGTGRPGPVFRQLLDAWRRHVGLDIVAQAQQFAER